MAVPYLDSASLNSSPKRTRQAHYRRGSEDVDTASPRARQGPPLPTVGFPNGQPPFHDPMDHTNEAFQASPQSSQISSALDRRVMPPKANGQSRTNDLPPATRQRPPSYDSGARSAEAQLSRGAGGPGGGGGGGDQPRRRREGASATKRDSPPQRLKTPSVADSVLHPLGQKVTEYERLMREAQDEISRLDDELRAMQARRDEAEGRFLDAQARHDGWRSQYADVERALRGEIPMPPPAAGPGVRPQQQQQQQQHQLVPPPGAQHGEMGGRGHHEGLGDDEEEEIGGQAMGPDDHVNGAGGHLRDRQWPASRQGSFGSGMSKPRMRDRLRFSLFGS